MHFDQNLNVHQILRQDIYNMIRFSKTHFLERKYMLSSLWVGDRSEPLGFYLYLRPSATYYTILQWNRAIFVGPPHLGQLEQYRPRIVVLVSIIRGSISMKILIINRLHMACFTGDLWVYFVSYFGEKWLQDIASALYLRRAHIMNWRKIMTHQNMMNHGNTFRIIILLCGETTDY